MLLDLLPDDFGEKDKNTNAAKHLNSQGTNTRFFAGEPGGSNSSSGLSMLIGGQSIMYAIFDKTFENVLELAHEDVDGRDSTSGDFFSAFVANHFLHRKKFEKVFVSVVNSAFTIEPASFSGSSKSAQATLLFSTGEQHLRTLKHRLPE